MTDWLSANPFNKAETIARRSTADGKHVLLWDDGSLTWALGYSIKGSAHPRTEKQRGEALRAGWLVLGEVELYDADEVPTLIAAARWVAKRYGDPGDVRARFAHLSAPKGLKPTWTALQTDRDGRPTLRVWRLPRLMYPGLAIWHERGRYEIMHEIGRSGAYKTTGMEASTLREIISKLPEPNL